MKISMMSVVIGLGLLLLLGCAPKPSYVAEWRADAGLPDEHLRSITVHITDAGACYVMAETSDGSEGGNGRWSVNEVGGIDIVLEDGDTATGEMLDADTLVISGDGDTVKFTRQ